jgi:hypothetical protein
MTLSVPGVPASCEKFPHSNQLNFWSTESIFNQLSVFVKTLNALCVCLQYKHPRLVKRVTRSIKPVTLLLLLLSHKCDFGAEPRSRIIATSAVKGLRPFMNKTFCGHYREFWANPLSPFVGILGRSVRKKANHVFGVHNNFEHLELCSCLIDFLSHVWFDLIEHFYSAHIHSIEC